MRLCLGGPPVSSGGNSSSGGRSHWCSFFWGLGETWAFCSLDLGGMWGNLGLELLGIAWGWGSGLGETKGRLGIEVLGQGAGIGTGRVWVALGSSFRVSAGLG